MFSVLASSSPCLTCLLTGPYLQPMTLAKRRLVPTLAFFGYVTDDAGTGRINSFQRSRVCPVPTSHGACVHRQLALFLPSRHVLLGRRSAISHSIP